jgi:hypothetical protein
VLAARDALAHRRDAEEPASPEVKIDFSTVAASDNDAMQIGWTCKVDHRSDNLFACEVRGWLKHCDLLNNRVWDGPSRDPSLEQALGVGSSVACDDGGGRISPAAHIELEHVRCCHDGLGMVAILKKCVSYGFGAVDEQAAKEAVLFLCNPVASAVLADKNQ